MRPYPLFFTPPKGTEGTAAKEVVELIATIPQSSWEAIALPEPLDQTDAPKP
jgi:predicted secreted protein